MLKLPATANRYKAQKIKKCRCQINMNVTVFEHYLNCISCRINKY